ncbi:MAG TPA: hypothetical protein VFV37_10135 [Luteibaculaceae bacterium]|nr:hypothetical protein [Luteibaculaceae bacterium]
MITWFKSIFHPSAKGYLSAWAALLTMAVYCVFFVNAKRWRDDGIIQQDVRIYYEYLPALFTHGDLSFSFLQNDSVADRHQYWLVTQPETGKDVPKYTLGLALVYAPVYLIHHGIARVLGHPIADFSTADGFGIAVSTLLFLGIGLLAARRLWLHWFSDTACAIALLTVFLGTNLLHYSVLSPGYGHVFSFALVALFANEALQWGKTNGSLRAAKMGFLFGLIVLIRPSNAVIGLFVLLVLPNIPNSQGIWQFWFSRWKPLLIAAIFALLAISPQLVVWKQITDSWVVYSYSTERFFFLQPQLLKVWFSFRNGWFTYAPVLLLIFPGFYFLFKLNRPLFWSTVPFFLINSLVIASWWCWWYGGSFGSRPHMDALAISALPLVAFWQGLQRPYLRMAAGLISVGLIALIGFQFKQSTRGIFHYDGMT